MNHIGLLCIKNEQDILGEWLHHMERYPIPIVIQDGSDKTSAFVIDDRKQFVAYFRDPQGVTMTDGHRVEALDWITGRYGMDTWVTLLHPDEFWIDSPAGAVEEAELEGADWILWGEYRHWLHPDDVIPPITQVAPAFCPEDSAMTIRLPRGVLPLRSRIAHWCGPFFEVRQFRLSAHHAMTPGKNHCVLPEGEKPGIRFSRIPRYHHFPFRSVEQMRRHARELMEGKRMIQPDWQWVCDLAAAGAPDSAYYVESLPPPINSPLASWWNKGTGDTPPAERFLPAWEKGPVNYFRTEP